MEQTQPRDQEHDGARVCHWHPSVEAPLYCSRCGKYMCVQCMVQATVGIHCRECGKAVPTPTYDVQPTYYARAIGVAVAVAIGGGLLWALLASVFAGIPFFSSLIALGIGYGAGEAISLSVNRKRGTNLAWITGGSVVGAFCISWLTGYYAPGIFGLLFLALAVYTAVQRVR